MLDLEITSGFYSVENLKPFDLALLAIKPHLVKNHNMLKYLNH